MWALDEYRPLRRVALRHARVAFRNQAFIDASWRALGYRAAPDFDRALAEFAEFARILTDSGATIEYLPAHDALTLDSIYVRDASIMTPDGSLSVHMRKDARTLEPGVADVHFRALGIVSQEVLGPGKLEGGDLVWLDDRTVVVGEGYRTEPGGIAALREVLPGSIDVVVCPLPHYRGPDHVFHLMSIFSPLDRDLALVFSPLMPVRFRRFLRERGIDLLEVPESEFEAMGCNVLAVAPRRLVMLDGLPETRRLLERAGCEVLVYAGDEISRKGEGGPTCLTRPLVRSDAPL